MAFPVKAVRYRPPAQRPGGGHCPGKTSIPERAGCDCRPPPTYAYLIHMEIDWDPAKGTANLRKHGVGFDEAATALLDPMALAQEDLAAVGEQRWVLVGTSDRARLLTVVYALRRGDRIRLISARLATRQESRDYA
jgi:uncharacterized protein